MGRPRFEPANASQARSRNVVRAAPCPTRNRGYLLMVPAEPSDLPEFGPQTDSVRELLPAVYAELRTIAARFMWSERAGHTLQPTALIHETYLRLMQERSPNWEDRAHFFAAAATVMRRILIDHARRKKASKRGGGQTRSPFDEWVEGFEERAIDLVELDGALDRLRAMDERKAVLVELRFFAGLDMPSIAELMGVSLRTVEREWTLTRAWLRGQIPDDPRFPDPA